jgi:hypothetical protein
MKKHNSPNRSQFDELSIKRRDRNLLQAYSSAIALDQSKVDALPRKHFDRYYSRGMWFRWRQCHLDFINELLASAAAMPTKLLRSLTMIAALARSVGCERKTMVEILSLGASDSLAPGQMIPQPGFFKLCWNLSAMGALILGSHTGGMTASPTDAIGVLDHLIVASAPR